jgi:hypothetical protein
VIDTTIPCDNDKRRQRLVDRPPLKPHNDNDSDNSERQIESGLYQQVHRVFQLTKMSQFSSHSPPPLRHPVPTHPAYIPDPPPTPGSPQGYQRFSSSPGPGQQTQQPHLQSYVPAHTTPFRHSQPPIPTQYQQEGVQQQNIQYMQPQHSAGDQVYTPDPDFGAWGLDATTAKFGMQLGHSAVAAGQQYVQKNVSS